MRGATRSGASWRRGKRLGRRSRENRGTLPGGWDSGALVRYSQPVVILGYLAFAFKIWMIIDALRRRVSLLWLPILMVPFGDWFYFVVVKLRDFNVRPVPAVERDAVGELERLERAAAESPSFHNRVRLGWALLERAQPGRAETCFAQALTSHPDDREGLYGLGLSQLEQERYDDAIESLTQLAEQSLSYEDYEPALALCEAFFASGRRDDTFALLHEITRSSHRLAHQVALAKYQQRAAAPERARETLRNALRDFEAQPDFLRRQNGAVATEARRLLRVLEPNEARDQG